MDMHSITPSMIEVWKDDAAGMKEKQLRQFAARRAIELGYGGITFMSEALGIDRKTIKVGIEEIEADDLHKKTDEFEKMVEDVIRYPIILRSTLPN